MDVLIAIPAFNEEKTVGGVVRAAARHGPVLVVDDGSTDDTAARATEAGAKVLRHEKRRGKGAALATALAAARAWGAQRVLTLDADGQHDPADVPALLDAAGETPHAIVIGSRHEDGLPSGRALAIGVAGFWVNWVAGIALADSQSGFRVYPLALFDAARRRGGRFVFETAVLVEAARHGWLVREVPIRVVPYAERPSRFHPLGDGAAITAYLVARGLGRWGVELRAAAREFFGVFSRERRKARHARMLSKASGHTGMPTWGPAIGVAALDEMQTGVTTWWEHPRTRRARRASRAALALPAVLALVIANRITRGALLPLLERTIRTIYDQRALPSLGTPPTMPRAEDSRTWATVSR